MIAGQEGEGVAGALAQMLGQAGPVLGPGVRVVPGPARDVDSMCPAAGSLPPWAPALVWGRRAQCPAAWSARAVGGAGSDSTSTMAVQLLAQQQQQVQGAAQQVLRE